MAGPSTVRSVPLVPPVLWPVFLAAAVCFGVASNRELLEIGEFLLAFGFCGLGLHAFLASGSGALGCFLAASEQIQELDRSDKVFFFGLALEALTRGSLAATLMVQGSRRGARRERSLALELAPTADLERRIRIGVAQSRRLLRLSGCTSTSG